MFLQFMLSEYTVSKTNSEGDEIILDNESVQPKESITIN